MHDKTIISVEVERLIAHPANPNRMAASVYKKLVSHIERTGNYEPIVVRNHPDGSPRFEILNGHHRLKALIQLGREQADCVVWAVDDDEAAMLLLTLNRLQGGDDLTRKSELIKSLSQRFDTDTLARQINESKKTIERLKAFTPTVRKTSIDMPVMLEPLMFYLTADQKAVIDKAFTTAAEDDCTGTLAQKKAKAITAICTSYIDDHQ